MKAETALEKIKDALFPTPAKDASGVMVDEDAYYNLEGALIGLERSGASRACINTVRRVQEQIAEAKHALNSFEAGQD